VGLDVLGKAFDHCHVSLLETLMRWWIIEDDRSLQKMLARYFAARPGAESDEVHGFHSAESAVKAIAALHEMPAALPDVVFVDLGLPGASGIDVIEQVRADGRFAKTVIIVASGRTSVDDHATSLAAGADGFLPKPYKPSALEQMALSLRESRS
jgi:DNA-binding response OmpR family regulator